MPTGWSAETRPTVERLSKTRDEAIVDTSRGLYPSERSGRISLSGNDGERKIQRSKFHGVGPALHKGTKLRSGPIPVRLRRLHIRFANDKGEV